MEPRRWERIQEIFHAAREQGDGTRATFLTAACGTDAELRAEVEGLLQAHSRSDSFLKQTCPADAPVRGRRIGRYELVREIGHGGMGTVYEALQENPRRTVALKVMRAGLPSRAALQRFEHEAQFLGRLHHPAIAQIYEAGIADSGAEHGAPIRQPYFAMEYIPAAQTIVQYAQAAKLGTRQRLEMLAGICDAVEHAHQMGIIHRDLKPANILIDGSGSPKVIDFGVARLTDSEITLATLQTGVGQLVGTLQYMSPEQCRSDSRPVDTRSDVYALGVVLFELLSGELPYDLAGKSVPESIRTVSEEDPRRLSSVSRAFRGDLDTIVAKALDKEPARRYASAAELAGDIRRYLRDEPLVARPASALYQFRKFARRNKALVGGVAAVLIVSLLGFAVSTFLYLGEQAARRAAGQQAEFAQKKAAEAEQARRAEEWRSYVASIAAGSSALRAYDVADARRLLDQAPEHLRGWEWRHFMRRLDRSRATISPQTASSPALTRLALAPDRTRIAFGLTNTTVHVWDVEPPREVARLTAHRGSVSSIAFSHDGSLLAAGGEDLTIKLWETRTFSELATLRGEPQAGPALEKARWRFVHSLAFSPDGRILAAGMWDRTLRLWDVASRQEIAILTGHEDRLRGVAFSPDGSRIATASWDRTVRLWDVSQRRCIGRLTGHDGIIFDVTFSPDGSQLASASDDGTIRIWEAQSLQELRVLRGHSTGVGAVAFTPDGRQLVSASGDKTVRIWDAASGAERSVLIGHRAGLTDIGVSSDGTWVASTSNDGVVKLWDVDCQPIRSLRGHTAWVYDVAVSPDGTLIASCGGEVPLPEMKIRLWDRRTGRPVAVLDGHQDLVWSLAFSPDGRRLASGSRDESIRLWDVERSALTATLPGHAEIFSLTFSPDGTRLVTASKDRNIRWWNADTGGLIVSRPDHAGWVWSVAFSPDGRTLASGSMDGTVRLWDGMTGQPLLSLDARSAVRCVAFSPDGATLAAGTEDGAWLAWSARDWKRVSACSGHGGQVIALTFSPDGTRVATASDDYTIKLWDVGRWQEVATLHGHTNAVLSVAFTPDGEHLVSGSSDLTVKLWDAGPP